MNKRTSDDAKRERDKDPALLKVARVIDPPGQEVSDDELIDPGKNIGDKPKQPVPARPPGGKR
jgi:hypothetical protein